MLQLLPVNTFALIKPFSTCHCCMYLFVCMCVFFSICARLWLTMWKADPALCSWHHFSSLQSYHLFFTTFYQHQTKQPHHSLPRCTYEYTRVCLVKIVALRLLQPGLLTFFFLLPLPLSFLYHFNKRRIEKDGFTKWLKERWLFLTTDHLLSSCILSLPQ